MVGELNDRSGSKFFSIRKQLESKILHNIASLHISNLLDYKICK